ncbi:MAG: HPr family phosphocarrier protein [Bacteroidota bacterium]
MVEKEITVINRSGLHTRPAATVVKLASKFKSDVFLDRDGFSINAKSIIGVMTLAAEKGSKLILRTDGPDEQEAADSIEKLFTDGFGEN